MSARPLDGRVVLVDQDDDALPVVRGGERLVVCEAGLLKTFLNVDGEHGQRQRLAESPRTRNKIKARALATHHAMHKRRLVDVDAPLLPQFREVARVCGYRSH